MKKFLTITGLVVALGIVALWTWGYMGVQANNDTLAEIKNTPGVIVLQVDGMT